MHAYWNTRFIARKNKPFLWSRGSAVVLVITTRCVFKCQYCPALKLTGEHPIYDECNVSEWKKFISEYPEHIEEIFISGGEPSLYPQISEFINWLTKEYKAHVCIFSNLWKPEAFLGLKKHWRLVLYPTFHIQDDKKRFIEAYNMLKDRIRVIPIEFSKDAKLPFTKFKDTYKLDYFINEMRLHFSPTTPRTKRTYTASLNLYADGTCIGAKDAVRVAIEREKE
jgi:organic radical activating enzyme